MLTLPSLLMCLRGGKGGEHVEEFFDAFVPVMHVMGTRAAFHKGDMRKGGKGLF